MSTKARDPHLVDVMKERIAPGLWRDGNGDVHINIPEILAEVGLPVTEANRALGTEMAMELLRKVDPEATAIYRAQPGPIPPL